MTNYLVVLVYNNGAGVKQTFRVNNLNKSVSEDQALQALQLLPSLGSFVDAAGDALYVDPVEAQVIQTISTAYKP
ncbi:DUF2922 family protein [Lacticaseibacillus sp. N501-2]|uniref:DUF2922 family protein n=1 Tax=Lacticaseibacillus salsurae TaxID=3367729 RepID=UPI0038B40B9D